MNIAFYLDEMNFRGVANSTFLFALNNKKILKNNSYIFYNKNNQSNKKEVIRKFKKEFNSFGIKNFEDIDKYKKKLNLKYLYVQKGGEKDSWVSKNIKTIVHCMYPQKLSEIHGYNYSYISEWLSKNFSDKKIPYVPLIVNPINSKGNLKKKFGIKKESIVLGCHGGESSFDLQFVKDCIIDICKKRKDLFFLFLNIKKFSNHPRIKFIKGTIDERFKNKFLNTCDYMIYGRSLGESFGLACAEFGIQNKTIISYKFNKHQSHKYNIDKKKFIEYSCYENLAKILMKIKLFKKRKINSKIYNKFNSKVVMKNFKKKFFYKKKITFSLINFLSNYLSHYLMNYQYLRHKIYNHYYNYIGSKLKKF